jgi:hypothetical protein
MINIFTAVVIAIASGGLGFLIGWLSKGSSKELSRSKDTSDDSIEVRHITHSMYPTRITFTEDLD